MRVKKRETAMTVKSPQCRTANRIALNVPEEESRDFGHKTTRPSKKPRHDDGAPLLALRCDALRCEAVQGDTWEPDGEVTRRR
jgi:hypothetical protein